MLKICVFSDLLFPDSWSIEIVIRFSYILLPYPGQNQQAKANH